MRTLVGLAMVASVACAGAFAFSPRALPPLAATQIPVGAMQLNGIARTSAGLVVAGELGHILLSTDGGGRWTPAAMSSQRQSLITRLVFADADTGLALGHEGWILRTEDGGRSWREAAFEPDDGVPLMAAARLASGEWLAVGAFGRALRSADNGVTWQRYAFPEETDWHLNAVAVSADKATVLVVGEAGTVLRSENGGRDWTTVDPFYNGSLYGVAQIAGGHWVAYGMRGNVFRSSDGGRSWQRSAVPVPVSLFGHVVSDGRVFLAGQGGFVLMSDDDGATFRVVRRSGRASLTDIAVMDDGGWLLTSDAGLQSFDLPADMKRRPATGMGPGQSPHTISLESFNARP